MADKIVPFLDPLRARVINALCLCDLPWNFTAGGHDCRLACGDNLEDAPFSSACSVPVQVGDGLWRLELGSLVPLRLLPELEHAWPEEGYAATLASLPEALRLAIIESLLGPLFDTLAQWLLCTVHVVEAPQEALTGSNWMAVQWEFALPKASVLAESNVDGYEGGTDTSGYQMFSVPVRLYWPHDAAARHVAGRLESLPRRQVLRPDIPVTCAVEVGNMSLPLHSLRGMETGDVLVVKTLHWQQPYVRLPDGTVFMCRAFEGSAVIVAALSEPDRALNGWKESISVAKSDDTAEQENSMTQETDDGTGGAMAETAQSDAPYSAEPLHVDVDKLEVTVRFELESMNLTVGDLAALNTGYTFALACDPMSPVTLRVGGVAVALGRMVDLNGVPGVQVTRLLAGAVNPS